MHNRWIGSHYLLYMTWYDLCLIVKPSLPLHENVRQRSINNSWTRISGHQGSTWIFQLITAKLTALIFKYAKYRWTNTNSKQINIANCKTYTEWLVDVEQALLLGYGYQTAETWAVYKSIDSPAVHTVQNTPHSGWLGDFYRILSEMTVWMDRGSVLPISQQFGSDPDQDLKWWSGIIAITSLTTMMITEIYFWWCKEYARMVSMHSVISCRSTPRNDEHMYTVRGNWGAPTFTW